MTAIKYTGAETWIRINGKIPSEYIPIPCIIMDVGAEDSHTRVFVRDFTGNSDPLMVPDTVTDWLPWVDMGNSPEHDGHFVTPIGWKVPPPPMVAVRDLDGFKEYQGTSSVSVS